MLFSGSHIPNPLLAEYRVLRDVSRVTSVFPICCSDRPSQAHWVPDTSLYSQSPYTLAFLEIRVGRTLRNLSFAGLGQSSDSPRVDARKSDIPSSTQLGLNRDRDQDEGKSRKEYGK